MPQKYRRRLSNGLTGLRLGIHDRVEWKPREPVGRTSQIAGFDFELREMNVRNDIIRKSVDGLFDARRLANYRSPLGLVLVPQGRIPSAGVAG